MGMWGVPRLRGQRRSPSHERGAQGQDGVTWQSSRQNLPCRKPSARSGPVTCDRDKPSCSFSPQTGRCAQARPAPLLSSWKNEKFLPSLGECYPPGEYSAIPFRPTAPSKDVTAKGQVASPCCNASRGHISRAPGSMVKKVRGKGQPSSAWAQSGSGTAALSPLISSAQLQGPLLWDPSQPPTYLPPHLFPSQPPSLLLLDRNVLVHCLFWTPECRLQETTAPPVRSAFVAHAQNPSAPLRVLGTEQGAVVLVGERKSIFPKASSPV